MKLATATSVLYLYEVRDAVQVAKQAGFEGVDLWGGRPHIYRHDYSQDDLTALRHYIEGEGLAVSSLMPAFYRYPHSLSNPNPTVRQDSIAYMRESLDNAVALGAPIVLVVPDLTLHGHDRAASLERFMASLDEVARYAADSDGIQLGIEILYTDETDFVNSAEDALAIIEALGHANLGVVLDTGTLNLSKEPVEDIFSKLGDRILQIHVNDNHGEERQENLIPGDGTYDFEALIDFLKQAGYSGFLSAELSKEYADRVEDALATTADRLSGWINHK